MSEFRRIVEENLIKYGYSLEEDTHKDRQDLLLALETYDIILKKLYKNIDNYVDEDDEININSSMENVNYFQLEPGYGTLIVIFHYDESETAGGLFMRDSNVISINLANRFSDINDYIEDITGNKVWIKPENYFSLLRERDTQSTFVHEFQHYLDNAKGILKKSVFQKTGNTDIDDKKYWNSAHERNAYTIQRIFDIVGKTTDTNDYKAMRNLTPEQRLDFMKNKWQKDEDFMNYYNKLEPKAQKRLLSRLYQYFSTDFWKDNNK